LDWTCVLKRIFRFISIFDDWISWKPILAFMSLYRELTRMAGEVLAQYLSCMAGEGCDDSCALSVSRTWREVYGSSYAILVLTVHIYCVMVIKHWNEFKYKTKLHMNEKIKNYMQVWLAEVLKDSVEFMKWNEENVLPYDLWNNFVCMT
jgi:hypothetical protein